MSEKVASADEDRDRKCNMKNNIIIIINQRTSSSLITMKRFFLFATIITQLQLAAVNAFSTGSTALASSTYAKSSSRCGSLRLNAKAIIIDGDSDLLSFQQRRTFLKQFVSSTAGATLLSFVGDTHVANAAPAKGASGGGDSIDTIVSQLKEARSQLDPVEGLIKEEKWDSVRAILIKPPLSDCWAKTSRPLLKLYADAMDQLPNGDELAVLELREDALDHLRFLDMAVYNNVFNPIKTEGETGATKELIRSYYEDPVKEFNACKRILDDLIALASQ